MEQKANAKLKEYLAMCDNNRCKQCGDPMVIDEWSGWVWTCFHCDVTGREATPAEIAQLEQTDSNGGQQ